MRRYFIFFLLTVFGSIVSSGIVWADPKNEIAVLNETVQKQQEVIQQLLKRVDDLESKLGNTSGTVFSKETAPAGTAPARISLETEDLPSLSSDAVGSGKAFPFLEWGGYIDVGYIDPSGEGGQASNAIGINSRYDSVASAGLSGNSTFLVNEINLDLAAHLNKTSDAIINFAILPRDLQITTTSGGTASTDTVELNEAYLVYAPELPSNAINDALFGDLRLSIGKFESPIGFEYRLNKSPNRINISRSHIARYTTGYPVGVRARGNLFQDKLKEYRNSIFTYNFVVANSAPNISRFFDGDRDDDSNRTFMSRLSYGLDILGGFFESGASVLYGARVNQANKDVISDWYNVDMRFEKGPWTIRAEWDYEDDGRGTGSDFFYKGIYIESFYVIDRPQWLPKWMPMVNIAPYYRYDTRYQLTTPATGDGSLTELDRHTLAVRYIPWADNILKFEFQENNDIRSNTVDDDLFLISFVRQF